MLPFPAHRIQSLRQAGLSIEEIRQILSGKDAVPLLEKRRGELMSELTETQHQLSRIQFILHGKEEEYFMNYTATLKDLPECIVYSKRMTIPSYDAYFEVLPALGQKMTEKYPDLQCAKPEYCFIIYLDGEYRKRHAGSRFPQRKLHRRHLEQGIGGGLADGAADSD